MPMAPNGYRSLRSRSIGIEGYTHLGLALSRAVGSRGIHLKGIVIKILYRHLTGIVIRVL